jgi:hypothetical protein
MHNAGLFKALELWIAAGIDDKMVSFLQSIAWETVQEYYAK